MKISLLFIYVFLQILIGTAVAQPLRGIPGLIPRDVNSLPATDLFYDGKVLLPHEALALQSSGVDLSDVNPQESDIWAQSPVSHIPFQEINLEKEGESVDFDAPILSRTGRFRFTVTKSTPSGPQTYALLLGKKSHNVMLRANLLKKLGYTISPIKWLSDVTVNFDSTFERENFENQLAEGTFGDPKRWIVESGADGKSLKLQDVLALEATPPIYNLAMGTVPAQIISRRRILNSLIVPYSLVYVPESINMLTWNAGRIVSESIKLEYEESSEFTPSFNDARWITKRILKLTRDDFVSIVKEAHYPETVSKLLVEKLISRRNDLAKLFELKTEKIKFDPKISFGKHLKKGKLTKEKWEGHGARYSYGNPDSPLSGSEIFNFFKSKLISNGISNLVGAFNQFVVPRTNLSDKIFEHQMKVAEQSLQDYLTTGVFKPTPFGLYAIPMFGADLIASRDIVAGTYMGSDNLVQLADSLGVSVNLGVFVGTDGIPAPWMVSGSGMVHLTRRYTHLRPIKSMKKALKTPYKNILVPLMKRKLGKIFDGLMASQIGSLDEEERQKKIEEVVGVFKEKLAIGESIVITDSLGGRLEAGVGYNFVQMVRAQAKFYGNQMIVGRLHIHRRDENTIQVYKDFGEMTTGGLNFGLTAFIPVIEIGFDASRGTSKTKFYSIDINPNEDQNPKILQKIQALRALFTKNDLEMIGVVSKPYLMQHKFKEKKSRFSLFHWRWLWEKTRGRNQDHSSFRVL